MPENKISTQQQFDNIAIKIINLLANENVSISHMDYIFESAKRIAFYETKIKKIEV